MKNIFFRQLSVLILVTLGMAWAHQAHAEVLPASDPVLQEYQRLKTLQETDPQAYQAAIESKKQSLRNHLQKVKSDPDQYQKFVKQTNRYRSKRLETWQKKEPEQFQGFVQKRYEKMEAMKERNPDQFQRVMESHPQFKEKLEQMAQHRKEQGQAGKPEPPPQNRAESGRLNAESIEPMNKESRQGLKSSELMGQRHPEDNRKNLERPLQNRNQGMDEPGIRPEAMGSDETSSERDFTKSHSQREPEHEEMANRPKRNQESAERTGSDPLRNQEARFVKRSQNPEKGNPASLAGKPGMGNQNRPGLGKPGQAEMNRPLQNSRENRPNPGMRPVPSGGQPAGTGQAGPRQDAAQAKPMPPMAKRDR